MHGRQGDGTEYPCVEATPRQARLLRGLVDLSERIHAERDLHAVIRAATEGARDLLGARRAATSVVLDPRHPRPIHILATDEGTPDGWGSSEADGLESLSVLDGTGGPDADPAWHPPGGIAAPLLCPEGRKLGLIRLRDKVQGEFTDDDQAALVRLSRLAAVAIGNAAAHQKLRGEAERKDEFLAMLAHELRNPLAAIGNAVRLVEDSDAREDLAWSMEVISRQKQHLSRLVDDLMDVSRIARGKIRLCRDVMEVTAILESAAATAGKLVEERKHSLELDMARGTLWAKVDPTRLEQVVVNLLNNAAKYSEDGGHIRLSGRVEEGEVVIRVKDGGFGIPAERLPEMFELFAQGDNSPLRSEGGLGVGLAVVKRLVELHGGTVTAASEGPGQGSEFTVRLPAAKEPTEMRPPATGRAKTARNGAKVLIADDDEDTARLLGRLLGLAGHEVVTAHRGDEAVGAAKAFRPEFILLDIGMPGMSGYEVASRLKREECCEKALFIAVSGYGQGEDRRRSKEAGFDHHLTKPIDHDALLSMLSAERT